MLTEYDYHCPKCNQLLNSEKTVVFQIKKSTGETGIIELDPKPGEYTYKCEPDIPFEKGEEIDFYCPACKVNLQSKQYPKYIEMKLRVNSTINFEVLFSRIFDDRRTYVITEDMIEKYGDNPEDLI